VGLGTGTVQNVQQMEILQFLTHTPATLALAYSYNTTGIEGESDM